MSDTPARLRRKQIVATSQQAINGVDYVEVLTLPSSPPGVGTLVVALLKSQGASGFGAEHVRVEGGVRVTSIPVSWVYTAQSLILGLPQGWTSQEQAELALWVTQRAGFDPAAALVVRTTTRGDLSEYALRLLTSAGCQIDALLSTGALHFLIDEPAEFDPLPAGTAAAPQGEPPPLDYTARDFEGMRRLMLDRLAVTLPSWTERSPADVMVTLVEVLADAADGLSYYQDAVATEAYLSTARSRTSVRRHTRLLDYPLGEGRSARVWVHVEVGEGLDGQPLEPPGQVQVQLLTRVAGLPPALDEQLPLPALPDGTRVFEPMHPVVLRRAHNLIELWAWGEESFLLPAGSTGATLLDPGRGLELAAGDPLLLEIVATEGAHLPPEGAARAHVVRLTRVTPVEDPLFTLEEGAPVPYTGPAPNPAPLELLEVAWHSRDVLPLDLPLGQGRDVRGQSSPLSVARGNLVLADHGRSLLEGEALSPAWPGRRGRPTLKLGPLTRVGFVRDERGASVPYDPTGPASAVGEGAQQVRPALWLEEPLPGGKTLRWSAQPDLLSSGPFSPDFVVEEESDGRARLRFGDGQYGRRPTEGRALTAWYRVGNGAAGNVGAGALSHVRLLKRAGSTAGDLSPWTQGILRVSNPLPAVGGVDPEPLSQARLHAPQALGSFRSAVTEADYEAAASEHPEVQKVVARMRWTGSWYTVFLAVDRLGGRPVDDDLRTALLRHLEARRMAEHDIKIQGPTYLPLDILLSIRVADGFVRANVRQQLLEELSARDLPGGRRGVFHPDHFTFGQPVYLSQLIAAAMAVPGVAWVKLDPCRFQRWGEAPRGELEAGVIEPGALEIVRLDNDPSQPERGKLELVLEGGL